MKNKITLTILASIILSVISIDSDAQSRFQSTKTLALGGGGIAYTSDYNALNPANIYKRRKNTFMTIGGLMNFNTQAGGSLLNITSYNKYLTGGTNYSVTDFRDKVIPSFFDGDESKDVNVQVDLIPLGFSYGNESWAIAGAVRTRVFSETSMNSGAMRLMAGMNEDMFGTPTAVNFGQSALAMGSFSLGFAMPVLTLNNGLGNHRLIAGIAPKVLFGVNYTSFELNSTVQVKNGEFIKHTIDYELYASGGVATGLDRFIADKGQLNLKFTDLFDDQYAYLDKPEEGAAGLNGNGFGLDFGLTYEYLPSFNKDLKITASFSVTDIGTLNFSKDAGIYGAQGVFNFSGVDFDQDRIDNEFDGDFNKYLEFVIQDSLAESGYGNIQKRASSYSKSLPTMYNFGFMTEWKFITWVGGFAKGVDEFGLNSTNMIYSTGLELNPLGFLPLRVGIRSGGSTSTIYSFGTGLEFKNYEFSLAVVGTSTSESGFLVGAALSGFTLRF